jgi:predicted nucleic acid-binding protein
MYIVDASVWVSRFIIFDAFHQPSFRWLEDYLSTGEIAVAPAILLVEVAGAVSRRTGQPAEGLRAASSIQRLPYSRLVPMQAQLVQMSAQLAAEQRLRGADALYVALAHLLGLPLVTWDRQQRGQDGHGIIALTPQEALTGRP